MKKEWIKTPLGNEVLNKIDKNTKEEFYISYNDFKQVTKEGAALGFPPVEIPEETAVIAKEGPGILMGDFRKEYEPCETLEECKKIYNDNEDSWK